MGRQAFIFTGLFVAVLLCMLASLHLGLRLYSPVEVWSALTTEAVDSTALVIKTLRLPRMLMAPVVGAALGIAGLLLQTTTRNPLASPALLGVNAGAAFAVVIAVSLFGVSAIWPLAMIAAFGALCATALVFALSAAAGGAASPLNTLLAGVTLAALLNSGVQIVLITDESTMEQLIFWLSGGFADRDLSLLTVAAPVIALSAGLAVAISRPLDLLLADDASAAALGVPVMQLRLAALGLAAMLAGAAVTTAGPVAFIGLVAPHMARRLGGLSHRVLVPMVGLVGAMLALVADIAARFVIYPSEAPVGAVLAFVGVPVLVLLMLSRKREGLAA